MKKLVKVLLLVCIMACMFCLSAYADVNTVYKVELFASTSGEVGTASYRENFRADIYVNQVVTDIKVELCYGDTVLCTATPKLGVADSSFEEKFEINGSVSCALVVAGRESGSWYNTWSTQLTKDNIPNRVKVYTNGSDTPDVFDLAISSTGNKLDQFQTLKPIAVIEDGNVVGRYDDLASAIADADSGAIIELKKGSYQMPSTSGKNITIKAADGESVEVVADTVTAHHGSTITFENVTIIAANENYTGMQHLTAATFNNCVIKNEFWSYATTAVFNGCTFDQPRSDKYNIWTYGSSVVEFNDCTFNSAGKSVLVYREAGINSTVTANDCDFNASDMVAGKAAIEIDSSFPNGNPNDYGYTIKINNSTASGFDPNSSCGNELWNNKKGEKTTVFNNNKQVYPALPEAPAKAPVSNRYNVPSTADNSNVPLWAVLFLGFAAVAVVTAGKKRRS